MKLKELKEDVPARPNAAEAAPAAAAPSNNSRSSGLKLGIVRLGRAGGKVRRNTTCISSYFLPRLPYEIVENKREFSHRLTTLDMVYFRSLLNKYLCTTDKEIGI